jgi:hypothetical protein
MDEKACEGHFSMSCCSCKEVRWLDAVRQAAFAAVRDVASACGWAWAAREGATEQKSMRTAFYNNIDWLHAAASCT